MKILDFIKKIILIAALCSPLVPCCAQVDANGANINALVGTDIAEQRLQANVGKRNSNTDVAYYMLKNGANIALALFITYCLAHMRENIHLVTHTL